MRKLTQRSFTAASTKRFDPSVFCDSQTTQLGASLTLVDHEDNIVGSVSKLDGHLRAKQENGRPHRAFSLFLFNTRN
jgi:hypothetical protein